MFRARRIRNNSIGRELIRETRISADSLVWPVFIVEGEHVKSPISSLEGQYHYSVDMLHDAIDGALKVGVNKFLLFGLPGHKDECGSDAYSDTGIVQRGIKKLRELYGDSIYIISDICMCEYTDHGHCGILHGDVVDNDVTLEYLAKIAVSHANAGTDMVAPSDMMDGRVAAIRHALDAAGYYQLPIMSYSVKYCSAFYGPFRDAAGSAPKFGNRKGYQMDYHNVREAIRESEADIAEGADILMVKPALAYLDVIQTVKERTNMPLAAYSVSGEYAMICAAAKAGLVDKYSIMCESTVAVFRAGADILITYFAKELADAINSGDIG